MAPNVKTTIDRVQQVVDTINGMTRKQVLIGIPSSHNQRSEGKAGNALIGYSMEHGVAKHNVPARPHLVPGVRAVQKQTLDSLKRAAKYALEGNSDAMMKQLSTIGLRAVSAVKQIIRAKIPPPLAPATVAGRLRRTQAGQRRLKKMRDAGADLGAWGASNLTPLIDTSSYLKAITYVVRDGSTGKEEIGGSGDG